MEDPVGMDILQTYCPDLVTGKVELDKSKFILQLVNLPLQSLLTIYIGEEAKKNKVVFIMFIGSCSAFAVMALMICLSMPVNSKS